jgi:ATP-binding cassette subfamily F protein 3
MNKMELIDEVVDDPSCVFIFPTAEKLRPPLLRIEDGAFGYSVSVPILKGININIENESRISIVGANGVGKSTLLKLLVGSQKLHEGIFFKNGRLRVSMFTQHHVDTLDLMLSPLEQIKRDYPNASTEAYRGHLSSFGLSGNMALRPNYLLSGGQKSRVAFALAVWN